MENRIIELETKISFQDKTIEDLHEALLAQQEELDRLEKELLRINSLLQKLLLQFDAPEV